VDLKHQNEAIKRTMAPTIVAEPLKSKVYNGVDPDTKAEEPKEKVYRVIIELNLDHPDTREAAREMVLAMLRSVAGQDSILGQSDPVSHPYIFAQLTAEQIKSLIRADGQTAVEKLQSGRKAELAEDSEGSAKPVAHRHLRAIFRIWESQKVHTFTTRSIRTVKADAAQISFGASGAGIVWAVLDSGIDEKHPHFATHKNLDLTLPLQHKTFIDRPWNEDKFGHGTHVAGIIAGQAPDGDSAVPKAAVQSTDVNGQGQYHLLDVAGIKGMAPKCTLLILRVLDDTGAGDEIALIEAIEHIQKLNDYGRNLLVQGVNISAGFWSDPKWYACGQTPLCVEVDRLVRSGVVVVTASGNTGNVLAAQATGQVSLAGQMMTINDPGNSALAITVGSTHREKPHLYGVSYFSSKGPTSDGRRKPEVLAPGEKIISCSSAQKDLPQELAGLKFFYIEDTGTSMAAPHVSGIVAAFLSIRREFIGRTAEVRSLVMNSATDLGRDVNVQGAGLVDLMRLIQSI
jgi:serine protease AprX